MSPADLAGWLGAALLIGAYAAASAAWLPTESRLAQLLNLAGSVVSGPSPRRTGPGPRWP